VANVYATSEWAEAREAALLRDGSRCSVGRLTGGACHDVLDVHHIVSLRRGGDPYDLENLITVCHAHHPMLERLRRGVRPARKRCPHQHRYPGARALCEARLNRAA
jgi:5-methylcytosine-specific restriction endonuclease McrA